MCTEYTKNVPLYIVRPTPLFDVYTETTLFNKTIQNTIFQ